MVQELIHHPEGFASGYTPITQMGEPDGDTGMNFGILKLAQGQTYELNSVLETACLLLHGRMTFQYAQKIHTVERQDYFKEDPYALHLPSGFQGSVHAESPCECVILQTENKNWFEPLFFDSQNMLESERRGKGILDDTAYRIVRTVFDIRNRPDSKLVLGEVITLPGKWSSYPPHHHPQPEIYHYRFTRPEGYGHGELGEEVHKIKEFDTLKILDKKDHAQTAAPGYGMMYVWAIRHLPENPYTVPEFTKAYEWTRTDSANNKVWRMEETP